MPGVGVCVRGGGPLASTRGREGAALVLVVGRRGHGCGSGASLCMAGVLIGVSEIVSQAAFPES